jgi:hypothetical protein
MTDCSECARLRGESSSAFSDYTLRKGELAMTRKADKSFVAKRKAFEQAQGRLSECHKRERQHRIDAHNDAGRRRESDNNTEKILVISRTSEPYGTF